MPSFFVQLLVGLLAVGAIAQKAPLRLCTGAACKNCPSSLTSTGTGFPKCVIYKRETVLGSSKGQFPPVRNGLRKIYYDVKKPENPECRTIIRSPADTTDPNCGVPIYSGRGGQCVPVDTASTFMVQFCCGTGDCSAAGRKRNGVAFSGTMTSAVLVDGEGGVVVPHSVGDAAGDHLDSFLEEHGLNSSSAIESRSADGTPVYRIGYDAPASLEKRKCKKFVKEKGPYTKTGSKSTQISGRICDQTSKVTIEKSRSISRTTTFGASVGDPFGIVQASVGFSTEKTASESYSYEFTPKKNQCGHVSFTPFFLCVSGKMTGCGDGDKTGEVCTAKRLENKQIDGQYTFVQTG